MRRGSKVKVQMWSTVNNCRLRLVLCDCLVCSVWRDGVVGCGTLCWRFDTSRGVMKREDAVFVVFF